MATARGLPCTADKFPLRKAQSRSRPPSLFSPRDRPCEIFGVNLSGSPCLTCENIHPNSHSRAPAASLACWESGHNHLRQTFRAPSDSSPENPLRRSAKPYFGGHTSEDSRAARSPSSLHLFRCTCPGRPCRPRSLPLKPALSENAEKFCERRRQQSESYQAHLRQDFAVQRTPAEWRVCDSNCLQAPG